MPRFRYITESGDEILVEGLPELLDAVRAGLLRGDTLLFDSSHSRWDKAAKHDAFRVALDAVQRIDLPTPESDKHPGESLGSALKVSRDVPSPDNPPLVEPHTEFNAAVQRLDEEFAEAKRLGFDGEFLARRRQSEYAALVSEHGITVDRAPERVEPASAHGAPADAAAGEKVGWWEIAGWTCTFIGTMLEAATRPIGGSRAAEAGVALGALLAYVGVSGLFLGWSRGARRFWGWGAFVMLLLARYGRSG